MPPYSLFSRIPISKARGPLYVHSLPGMQKESLASFIDDLRQAVVSHIVCLVEDWELHDLAPAYLKAIQGGALPAKVTRLPISDGRAPEDRDAFIKLVSEVALSLQQGKAVLVHCRGGIGRTGTFAVAVLMKLGFIPEEALRIVRDEGPGPETREQELFLAGLKFS